MRGHITRAQLKVMSAIEACRTADLGGHVARCANPVCGHTTIAYNSCRNRHCPKCQGSRAREWLEARRAELLEVPYFHAVFTLPPGIAAIAYQNKAVIYDLLFKASADTLLTIAADPKRLGVKIGFTSVLHTWGSAMTHHPHVHMIVPGGGIAVDGQRWIGAAEDFLLPVPVLSRMFRGKMLAMLKGAHADSRLQFFGPHADLADKAAFKAWLKPLYAARWHVYAKRPFAGPEAVLAYLARYTHRVAISNKRLIKADETGVTFTFKDYRIEGPGRYKTMTVAPDEFIRRADRGGNTVEAGSRTPTAARRQDGGDRQAGASLPVLRRHNGDHRDVRGRPDATPPAEPDADRSRDRHVMMPIAIVSVTADESHCWLSVGHDGARLEQSSAACHKPCDDGKACTFGLFGAAIASKRTERHFTRGLDGTPLHRQRQPIPHSAR